MIYTNSIEELAILQKEGLSKMPKATLEILIQQSKMLKAKSQSKNKRSK